MLRDEVPRCRVEVGDRKFKCNRKATQYVHGVIEVMGKKINVTLPCCDIHLEKFQGRNYDVASKN